MSRSTDWQVLGVQKRWSDGAYAWAEDYEKNPRRRFRWYLTRGGENGYDFEGTAPTLAIAMQRILAARFEAVRR